MASSEEVTSRRKIRIKHLLQSPLTSHHDYKAWRQTIDEYLEQEGLLHVVQNPPRYPPLGLTPESRDRKKYVDYHRDQERVRVLLLRTIPLESFKEKKDKTPYDMLTELEKECEISVRQDAERDAAMERLRQDLRDNPPNSHVPRWRKLQEGPSNNK